LGDVVQSIHDRVKWRIGLEQKRDGVGEMLNLTTGKTARWNYGANAHFVIVATATEAPNLGAYQQLKL
jgi:hypothetical protein